MQFDDDDDDHYKILPNKMQEELNRCLKNKRNLEARSDLGVDGSMILKCSRMLRGCELDLLGSE